MENFEIDFDGESGPVLDRVIEAYGFSAKMMLAEHLNMAPSTLSGRYRRGGFPADIVVKCLADTGVNLSWLVTGEGRKFDDQKLDALHLRRRKIIDGQMFDAGYIMIDKSLVLDPRRELSKPFLLVDEQIQYLLDQDFAEVSDGKWLVEIEGKTSIRTLTRIPIKKVRVSGVGMAFDCALDDITVLGRVILTIE